MFIIVFVRLAITIPVSVFLFWLDLASLRKTGQAAMTDVANLALKLRGHLSKAFTSLLHDGTSEMKSMKHSSDSLDRFQFFKAILFQRKSSNNFN